MLIAFYFARTGSHCDKRQRRLIIPKPYAVNELTALWRCVSIRRLVILRYEEMFVVLCAITIHQCH